MVLILYTLTTFYNGYYLTELSRSITTQISKWWGYSSCCVATPIRSIVWHILLRHRCKLWDHHESMSVCSSSWHSRRCSIVWSASLQSHVVSSSSVYFHFLRLCLQRPIFVRSLFRHLHSVHVPDAPLARHSLGVCGSLWGTYCRCLDHCSNLRVDGLWIC